MKFNDEALLIAAKKLRRLRIETIGGFKERPARTIGSIIDNEGDLKGDNEFVAWMIKNALRYYSEAIASGVGPVATDEPCDCGETTAVQCSCRLYDDQQPMASEAGEMTAAEDVIAWLIIEKIGVPDDVRYSPHQAQKIIENALDEVIGAIIETISLRESLKEANAFILAPAEDLKEGVLSRIRAALASGAEPAQAVPAEDIAKQGLLDNYGSVPECPHCGKTEGLRVKSSSFAPGEPEYICEGCFTPADDGPCFDDLRQI